VIPGVSSFLMIGDFGDGRNVLMAITGMASCDGCDGIV
jgi:hypothetical protein